MAQHATLNIPAQIRTEFGKGAARRIRRENRVPAVLYGHGTEPVHLILPGHEMMMALKNPNAVLTLDIEGKEQLALAKDVQREVIRRFIQHVDLVIVRKGEKVSVDVPVHLEGDAAPGTTVFHEMTEVTIEAEAMHIPERILVSVEGLQVGSQILAKDLTLPQGVTLAVDEDALIVHVAEEAVADIPEPEAAEAPAAEGEAAAGAAEESSEES